MKNILAKNVMTSPVITVLPTMSLQEALTVLDNNPFTGLPVVNEKREILGMITETDVIRYTQWIIGQPLRDPVEVLQDEHEVISVGGERGADMIELVADTKVETLMTQEIFKVKENDTLLFIVRLLNKEEINRVPVINDQETLTGIITRADILLTLEAWFAKEEE